MKRSIIFCQASAKVTSVLNCYEQEIKENRKVQIIVRCVPELELFFKYLGLDAEIIYFDDVKVNEYHFGKRKRIMKERVKSLKLDSYSDVHVFFTDIYDDMYMGVYLKYLMKYNPTHILSAYEMDEWKSTGWKIFSREYVPLKLRLMEWAYSLLYGYSFKYSLRDHWTLTLNTLKYHYPWIDYSDASIINKHKVTLPYSGKKNVIFFAEPYRNKFQTKENYDIINVKIVEELHKAGYKVGVKGHPRIGCHPDVLKVCDYEIPSYIPSQYLDITVFDFAISFVSTALCSASEVIKAYSVLPMCEIVDEYEKDFWIKYLIEHGKGNVVFIDDISKIDEIK